LIEKKEDKIKIVEKFKVGDLIKGAEVKVTVHLVVSLVLTVSLMF
jgi:hypothetical protein